LNSAGLNFSVSGFEQLNHVCIGQANARGLQKWCQFICTMESLANDSGREHGGELEHSRTNGTVAHLATELLQREANVKLTHIPYKGAAQGINDVMGGQVQLYVSSVPTLIGHIKNGKLRALAVTSAKRVDDLPQTPTVAESGYKGFDAVTWFGLLGPANLPAAVVTSANTELNKALNAPDLRKKLEDQGLTVTPTSASEFGQLIQRDIAKWAPVVKGSGAKVD
jgi:tripartite-type tricarboxylate transporter receptor subunit TctC